jgi:tetratricopeptide (TPR) repeat protein
VIRDFQDAIATARAAGDKLILGYSLEMFYVAAAFISVPGTEEAADEGFKIFTEEVNDNWGLSMAYQNKARVAANKGNDVEKEKYFAKFKELIEQAPLSVQAGLFYLGMGINEKNLGNFETAKTFFEEGLDIFNQIRSLSFQLVMKSELAHIARHTGKLNEAKNIYRETLIGWQNIGHRGAIANQLECFAFLAMIEEEPKRAAKLLGAAEILRERIQSPMTDHEQIEYGRSVAQLRSMLKETELTSVWSEGRLMTMDQAIQFALGHE